MSSDLGSSDLTFRDLGLSAFEPLSIRTVGMRLAGNFFENDATDRTRRFEDQTVGRRYERLRIRERPRHVAWQTGMSGLGVRTNAPR
jgi:hypothetical protein